MTEPNQSKPTLAKKGPDVGQITAMLATTILIGLAGWGIWVLQPKKPTQGRPVGEVGAIQLRAEPLRKGGEDFSVWRGTTLTFKTPEAMSGNFQRVEVSSTDINVAGGPEPDLVVYGWTGGAHCCFMRFVFDGKTGKLLGQFDLGNSDGSAFVVPRNDGASRGIMVAVDDVFANHFGSFAGSPMGRILIAWNGQGFGLDTKRMAAASADGPPTYFTSDPDLSVLSVTSDLSEESEAVSDSSNNRGDQAARYQSQLADLKSELEASPPRLEARESWVPMLEVLNDYVYKGQAEAGVRFLSARFGEDPDLLGTILGSYFAKLKESRWFGDLDALNNGKLSRLSGLYPERPEPVALPTPPNP
jgi:hypothetical protein